jgi:hypothetical protein
VGPLIGTELRGGSDTWHGQSSTNCILVIASLFALYRAVARRQHPHWNNNCEPASAAPTF